MHPDDAAWDQPTDEELLEYQLYLEQSHTWENAGLCRDCGQPACVAGYCTGCLNLMQTPDLCGTCGWEAHTGPCHRMEV